MANQDARIRSLPLGGTWETLGVDRLAGIVPEGLAASSDSWGPLQMSFNLKAEKGARRPDLLPFTPIELEIGGVLCWAGEVWQRPTDDNNYQVICRGWQFHLDDDLLDRAYVHTRIGDYRDARSFLTENLTTFHVGGTVSIENGVAVIGWPNGAVVPANGNVGITLDLGPDSTAKRVVMTWDSSNNAAVTCLCRATDAEDSGNATFSAGFSFLINSAASGTASGTFTTARRYVHVFLNIAGGATFAGDVYLRIKTLQVFRDTAYESGNASILKADTVIKDALAAKAPRLNQSTALISAGTFSLPEYLTGGYLTPRQIMEAVNAYENFRLKIGDADLKTLVFAAKPSAPIVEAGEASGGQFDDATVSGEEIYDSVVTDATGPDGGRLVSKRTQTGTLVDRRGFHRSRTLPISSAVTSAVADRFGDLWLAEHKTAAFSGRFTVAGDGLRRVLNGQSVPAHELLLLAGEKIRLANRIDPDTGAVGRDGRIAAVGYTHDTRTVEISIDDQRDTYEKVLARYGLLAGLVP